MFTGIVEELGEVTAVTDLGDSARLEVRGSIVTADVHHGESIAVNGVCLTVVEVEGDRFTTDVMRETLRCSSLGVLAAGSSVNLERAVRLSGRLGGHIVQGHVDGTATILEHTVAERWDLVRIGLAPALSPYVVRKGSIAVDGVSLTVAGLDPDSFTVSLIPTTIELTTLGLKQPGDIVNLEVDVIAKYVERMLGDRAVSEPAP